MHYRGLDGKPIVGHHWAPMAPIANAPETDEYGFAPTRIVRARWSQNGGVLKFFRVWMKPSDLSFPIQERELRGVEAIEAMMKFMQRGRRAPEDIRLDATTPTPTAGGVCPDFSPQGVGEVIGIQAPADDAEVFTSVPHPGTGVSPQIHSPVLGEV